MPTLVKRDQMVEIPLASLIEDWAFYPRVSIDEVHVGKLVKALEAGETLPAPVADKQSKKIADGFHRRRAHLRVLGPTGVIKAILRDYANEDEFLLDAIDMNSHHGKALETIDITRAVNMLHDRGIEISRIMAVIHRTEPEIHKLLIRVAQAPSDSPNIIPGTRTMVALKRPVLHLANTVLTNEQAKALPTVPGTPYQLLARQLLDAVRHDLANRKDEALQRALCELRDALIAYCG